LRRGAGRRLTDSSRADIHDCARSFDAKGTETILVVDDEELVRNLVQSLLKSHGYGVLQAARAPKLSISSPDILIRFT